MDSQDACPTTKTSVPGERTRCIYTHTPSAGEIFHVRLTHSRKWHSPHPPLTLEPAPGPVVSEPTQDHIMPEHVSLALVSLEHASLALVAPEPAQDPIVSEHALRTLLPPDLAPPFLEPLFFQFEPEDNDPVPPVDDHDGFWVLCGACFEELAGDEHVHELGKLADAARRNAKCVEAEACVVAQAAVRSDHLPAARHLFTGVEACAGHKANMAQSIEVVEMVVGRMDVVHAFFACVEEEDDA